MIILEPPPQASGNLGALGAWATNFAAWAGRLTLRINQALDDLIWAKAKVLDSADLPDPANCTGRLVYCTDLSMAAVSDGTDWIKTDGSGAI